MRPRTLVVATIVAAFIAGAAPAGAAPPPPVARPGVVWKGHTTQGLPITFRTVRGSDGQRSITSFGVLAGLTCPSGEDVLFGLGYQFFEGGIPVASGDFAFDDVSFDTGIHFSGHLGALEGSGVVRLVVAALTPEEEAQLCTTGDLGWKADREPATSTAATSVRPDVRVDVTVRAGGSKQVVVSSGGRTVSTRTSTGTSGIYEGKSAQDFPVAFRIVGPAGSRVVRWFVIGAFIDCAAAPFDIVSIAGFFGFDTPLHHGAWAFDWVDLSGGFHFHGSIASAPARGDLRIVHPVLTADEQAVACSSGDVRWKATPATSPAEEGTSARRVVAESR